MALTRPRAYQIETSIESISDPITVLHAGATLANVDVGFLVNRANGLLSNVAIYWSESGNSFVTAFTSNSGGTDSNITVSSYAPITVGNVITTNGVFWANGAAYSSGSGGGSYGNTQVAQYLPTYTGNVTAANVVVTSGVYSPAYFYANGTPFVSSGSAGAKITTSSTAPVSPAAGDFWYDPTTDIKSQYVNDGVASYWVDETGPTISNAAPVTTVGNIVGTTGGNAYITGTLIPTSNIAYDLGTTTQRFRSLYLSGNTIDLGGATIKTDAVTGAVAIVPQPTVTNPNPTGIVVSPSGTVSTVVTSGGVVSANAIGTASNTASASGTSTFSNANVSSTLTAGNIVTTSGVFWANGASALVSSYGNTQVAQYLPTYSGNVNAANVITTSGVYSPAYFYANGVAFTSSSYGNTQVAAYLPTYSGNIAGHGVVGNLTVYGNLSITGNVTTVNYETVLYTETANVINANTANIGNLFVSGLTNHLGNIAFNANTSATVTLDMGTRTDAIILPKGNIAQRPSAVQGEFRFNTASNTPEFNNGTNWYTINGSTATWRSFYDFRNAASATNAYRYDDANSLSPAASATYSISRRTQTLGGYTCAGVFPGYSTNDSAYRMNRTGLSLPYITVAEFYYKNIFYSNSPVTGGFLTMGMNFIASSWNVQTDMYRDGTTNPDGYDFTTGGNYGSGTRNASTISMSNAGSNDIFCMFKIYNGTNWKLYVNSNTTGTNYITITPGTGNITEYGMLDRQNYGGNYDDGTNFMSAFIVYDRVLSDTEMSQLVSDRYRICGDPTYFGIV